MVLLRPRSELCGCWIRWNEWKKRCYGGRREGRKRKEKGHLRSVCKRGRVGGGREEEKGDKKKRNVRRRRSE